MSKLEGEKGLNIKFLLNKISSLTEFKCLLQVLKSNYTTRAGAGGIVKIKSRFAGLYEHIKEFLNKKQDVNF
jgi:hypothetical protein